MARTERTGKRKTREQISRQRTPELGSYFIVTDTKETEQNYIYLNFFKNITSHG